jgi:hypothetical protein
MFLHFKEEERITLQVTPQKWSGFGVLGCHFYCLRDKAGAFVKVLDLKKDSPG